MTATPELDRLLLANLKYDPEAEDGDDDWVEGVRVLLTRDPDGHVLRHLAEALPGLKGVSRAGLAFVVAERYRETGDLGSLEALYATGDAKVKGSVLDALWGEPGANPLMGPGIVTLAVQGAGHRAARVRNQACSVFQNQSGWKVDVSGAVGPLLKLLADKDDGVRMMAACAVGNLAKAKYDLTRHVAPLVRNLGHEERQVRQWAAWALWQLSRHKHDIAAAVPELARGLTYAGEYGTLREYAAGALLHYAKKSPENAARVRGGVGEVTLDLSHKAIKRFADQLTALG